MEARSNCFAFMLRCREIDRVAAFCVLEQRIGAETITPWYRNQSMMDVLVYGDPAVVSARTRAQLGWKLAMWFTSETCERFNTNYRMATIWSPR